MGTRPNPPEAKPAAEAAEPIGSIPKDEFLAALSRPDVQQALAAARELQAKTEQ